MSKSTKEKDYGQYSSGKYIQKSRLDELVKPSILEPLSLLNSIFHFYIRPSKKRNADKTRMFSLVITSQILLSTMNQPLQVEPLQALWQLFWKDPKNINRYVVIKYSPGQWMWQSIILLGRNPHQILQLVNILILGGINRLSKKPVETIKLQSNPFTKVIVQSSDECADFIAWWTDINFSTWNPPLSSRKLTVYNGTT